MKFYKYRCSFAVGYSPWQITHVDDSVTPKQIKSAQTDANNWSEHFRGVEVVRIKHPGNPWLLEQIRFAEEQSKYYHRLADELGDHLIKELK